MLTYLGKFIPGLSQHTATLRNLAKREPFTVDGELTSAFQAAQQLVGSCN